MNRARRRQETTETFPDDARIIPLARREQWKDKHSPSHNLLVPTEISRSTRNSVTPAASRDGRPLDFRGFASASPTLLRSRTLLNRVEHTYLVPLQAASAFLAAIENDYHVLRSGLMPREAGQPEAGYEYEAMPYETVYYDSHELSLYRLGSASQATDRKIRIRKYPARGLSFLEVKSKSPAGRTSKERRLRPMSATEISSAERSFLSTQLPIEVPQLCSQVCVRYNRATLLARRAEERITLDIGLRYENVAQSIQLQGMAIIEVKQLPAADPSRAHQWLMSAGPQPRGFSKYRTGLWLRERISRPETTKSLIWNTAPLCSGGG